MLQSNGNKPAVLTSWKEIASYVGKGVRTVQRWEKLNQLPVRRVSGTSKIVAYREELERWLRAQPMGDHHGSLPTQILDKQDFAGNVTRFTQLRKECEVLRLALHNELAKLLQESQEATNEELQSANEEIQSGNEELQSTNEDLQTSKEELESANEELHTVNEEMQHRNELLSQLNNDLTNLLNSVNLPLVMVGSDLSVRRFTPQAATVLGLVPSDVGRPIPRLKLKIEVENLEHQMLDVLVEVRPKQFKVKDADGNWCSFRLAPYRTLDNRIDGVVLSIVTLDSNEK